MSTGAAGPFAARQLFTALLDDAALYPPGNALMVRAVPAHLGYGETSYADLVGPFLCPASRLDELRATLGDLSSLDLTLIVDTGAGGVADAVASVGSDDRLRLRGLEIPLRADHDLGAAARRTAAAVFDAELPDGVAIFVEVPRGDRGCDALDVLAEYDLAAKLRTGGTEASAYPTELEVATFLLACVDREVALKCTAGLHHAVRNTARGTGFEQHGYLNLLAAVRAALDGADADAVAKTLAERDPSVVATKIRAITAPEAAGVRTWFRSFGTCSIDEPVEDMVALGVLDAGGTTP
jgi:hypothetical protein